MFNSYAHTDPGEDDSVSASGSFNLASLVGNSKYKRSLGQKPTGSLHKVVRSAKKSSLTPVRTKTNDARCVSDFNSKLASIEEDSAKDKKVDVSLSDLLANLGVNTPRPETRTHVTHVQQPSHDTGHDKVSPDSGSFTMSTTKTRPSILDRHMDTNEFTDQLKRPSILSSSYQSGHHGTTVNNMSTTGHHDISHNKENVPAATGSDRQDITSRLQALIQTTSVTPAAAVGGPAHHHESRHEEHQPSQGAHHHQEHHPSQGAHHPNPQSYHHSSSSHTTLDPQPGPPSHSAPHKPPPVKQTSLPHVHHQTPVPHVHHQTPVKLTTASSVTNLPSKDFVTPAMTRSVSMPPPKSTSKEKVLIVNDKRYKVMKLLGKGGSSRVYEAFDEENNIVVAIKRVELADADESQREGFINEINMLRKLQGQDRIIKLYDYENVVDETDELLYVVMEKGDTDLASLLKKYSSNKELTPAMIKHYWAEMLHAVACIHKNGIIHKDLKPANFMLVAGRLKLIDFGIATSIQSDKTSITIDNQMGTFNYMSPESIQDISGPQFDKRGNKKPCIKISYKTDVWSLGCILYQLTYGKLPFADIKHPLMKLQAITNVDHRIEYPQIDEVDPRLVDVIKSCLERDISQRPSVEQLLDHSYLTAAAAAAVTPAPAVNINNFKMMAAFEGFMSPNTLKKTKEYLRQAGQLE